MECSRRGGKNRHPVVEGSWGHHAGRSADTARSGKAEEKRLRRRQASGVCPAAYDASRRAETRNAGAKAGAHQAPRCQAGGLTECSARKGEESAAAERIQESRRQEEEITRDSGRTTEGVHASGPPPFLLQSLFFWL